MSGRHRPVGGAGRRSLRTPLTLAAVGALVTVTAVAVQVMAADAEGCGSGSGVTLTVAAAPEIAPAVQDAADQWAHTQPEVNGKCIHVDVRAVSPADVAGGLAARGGGYLDVAAQPAATPSEPDTPAVWIPDSTSWLHRVMAVDRSAFGPQAPSVAMSPVVLAVRASVAEAMEPTLGTAGAKGIVQAALGDAKEAIKDRRLPKMPIGIVDPRRDAASLGGAMVLRDIVMTDESKAADLIAIYRLINKTRVEDPAALPQAFAQAVQVAPMTEQAVISFNATNPPAPLAAIPLGAGAPALDYPFATLSGSPREIDEAAAKLRAALTGGQYREAFSKRGFRNPDGTAGVGFPAGSGITAETISATPMDNPDRVAQTIGYWQAANAPSRALALFDLSSSMSQLEAGSTRFRILQQSAIAGLQMFSDSSSLGIWTFTSDHKELTPILELNSENRKILNSRISALRPSGNSESALFMTFRDAYRMMTETYVPGVSNRIIVLTDGPSSTTGVKSLEALNRELENIAVVTKPIEVTLIGVGSGVDRAELEEIARMTGGVAAYIEHPAQIQSVFLQALLS